MPGGRPRGEIAQALLNAAAKPGTVRQLAHRSLVGLAAARWTASRMLVRGELVSLSAPGRRPYVLMCARAAEDLVGRPLGPKEASAHLQQLLASRWRPMSF